jgi:hypothetical protein
MMVTDDWFEACVAAQRAVKIAGKALQSRVRLNLICDIRINFEACRVLR